GCLRQSRFTVLLRAAGSTAWQRATLHRRLSCRNFTGRRAETGPAPPLSGLCQLGERRHGYGCAASLPDAEVDQRGASAVLRTMAGLSRYEDDVAPLDLVALVADGLPATAFEEVLHLLAVAVTARGRTGRHVYEEGHEVVSGEAQLGIDALGDAAAVALIQPHLAGQIGPLQLTLAHQVPLSGAPALHLPLQLAQLLQEMVPHPAQLHAQHRGKATFTQLGVQALLLVRLPKVRAGLEHGLAKHRRPRSGMRRGQERDRLGVDVLRAVPDVSRHQNDVTGFDLVLAVTDDLLGATLQVELHRFAMDVIRAVRLTGGKLDREDVDVVHVEAKLSRHQVGAAVLGAAALQPVPLVLLEEMPVAQSMFGQDVLDTAEAVHEFVVTAPQCPVVELGVRAHG